MRRHRRTEFVILSVAILAGIVARAAFAKQENREGNAADPCAILSAYDGSVQIMDATRSQIIGTVTGASIPCGGWVSVGQGWARLAHRDGFSFQLAPDTFVQLPENNGDGKFAGDTAVLFKGQVYAKALDGAGAINMVTANSRARIKNSSAIFVYNSSGEETQLITLSGAATLENRFQAARKIQVHAGEASELNFQQMRLVPSVPRAVSIASLKPKLMELHLSEKDRAFAMKKTAERSDRKFASEFEASENPRNAPDIWDNGGKEAPKPRKPAAVDSKTVATDEAPAEDAATRYRKSEAAIQDNKLLQSHFARRLTGGQDVGDQVLFPKERSEGRKPASIEVVDPAEKLNQAARKLEDREKKKLIEELSQIRAD